jgi:hypothetical protein
MEEFGMLVPVLLWIVISIITGLLAARKGYNFFLWLLAAGCIGLIILAFLPFANKPELAPEEQARLKKTGDTIGGVLTGIGLLLGLLKLLGSN